MNVTNAAKGVADNHLIAVILRHNWLKFEAKRPNKLKKTKAAKKN